jgi:serine/threonine protein kinase
MLHFLLEAALGGELYSIYRRLQLHGSERHAKFYAAGVALALAHLHERSFVYRSIKPENVVLNSHGYPKLTDFDLAKFVVGKTFTTCGTPDYFAPELIASSGHSFPLDWWTLGVLIFELLSGSPPFESAFPMQIYSKVVKGIDHVTFPPKCKGPVEDLCKALLQKEPSKRLPARAGGIQNLKDHKWYAGFDWPAFADLKLEAPYKPVVKSNTDISNFSASEEDRPKAVEYSDDGSDWDKDFATA